MQSEPQRRLKSFSLKKIYFSTLNVSPAFSVRREINLSPNADAGVKKPPESDINYEELQPGAAASSNPFQQVLVPMGHHSSSRSCMSEGQPHQRRSSTAGAFGIRPPEDFWTFVFEFSEAGAVKSYPALLFTVVCACRPFGQYTGKSLNLSSVQGFSCVGLGSGRGLHLTEA